MPIVPMTLLWLIQTALITIIAVVTAFMNFAVTLINPTKLNSPKRPITWILFIRVILIIITSSQYYLSLLAASTLNSITL